MFGIRRWQHPSHCQEEFSVLPLNCFIAIAPQQVIVPYDKMRLAASLSPPGRIDRKAATFVEDTPSRSGPPVQINGDDLSTAVGALHDNRARYTALDDSV